SSTLKRFEPTLVNFLMLSFLLFVVGVAGVLSRRNIIIIFMSIELILNAVNLNMIAFSRYLAMNQKALADAKLIVEPLTGPVFPLLGFLVNFILGRKLRLGERAVSVIGCGVIALSLLLTIGAFVDYAKSYAPAHNNEPYVTSGGFPQSFEFLPGGAAHTTLGQ